MLENILQWEQPQQVNWQNQYFFHQNCLEPIITDGLQSFKNQNLWLTPYSCHFLEMYGSQQNANASKCKSFITPNYPLLKASC